MITEDYAAIKDYEEKVKFFKEFQEWLNTHDPYTQVRFEDFYKKFKALQYWIHDHNGWDDYLRAEYYADRIYRKEKSYVNNGSMESDYKLCLSNYIPLIIKELERYINWLESRQRLRGN